MKRYRFGKLIGRGGMAEVYEGWRRLGGGREQRVAIKRLLPELASDPEIVARFTREADVSLRMSHPNIVKVFDLEPGDEPWIIMELVDGMALGELVDRFELCPEEIRSVLIDVLTGLAYLHDSGVLHRDLSPNNILLSQSGQVMLTDLGLCKFMAAPRSDPSFKGTAALASPEALECRDLDPGADLYSVGALAYWMLTRQLPHGDGDHVEIRRRMAAGWDVAPLPETAPVDLREIITGLLVPVEARRYRTADEVLDALVRHDLPVASPRALARTVREALALRLPTIEMPPHQDIPSAPQPEAAAEQRPAVRRRRRLLAVAVPAVVLVLGLVTAGVYWAWPSMPASMHAPEPELPARLPELPACMQEPSVPSALEPVTGDVRAPRGESAVPFKSVRLGAVR